MNNDIEYKNRQLIPRWLPYSLRPLLGNAHLIPPGAPNDRELEHYSRAQRDWEVNKSVSFAVELTATAATLGLVNSLAVQDAIDYIDRTPACSKIPTIARLIAVVRPSQSSSNEEECIEIEGLSDSYVSTRISGLRRQLRAYPGDALRWLDLALQYTLAGTTDKALTAVLVATTLGAKNTFILRSAARYLVHIEQPDRALALLRSGPIASNPLLLASEISISEAFGLKSRFVREARSILESGDHSPHSLSEIAATLSTLEFNAGNDRKGKRLLRSALAQPNENTLAQAQFLTDRFSLDFNPSRFDTPCKFEASAWNNYGSGKYAQARMEATKWYYFQPFTSRAALLSSYISSVIYDNCQEAIPLLDHALRVSPQDPGLCNNKAFALARLGKTDAAVDALRVVKLDGIEKGDWAVIQATMGLISLRQGKLVDGERLYNSAIEYFQEIRDSFRLSRAYYFFATEMLAFDQSRAVRLMHSAKESAKKGNVRDILYLIENTESKFDPDTRSGPNVT